MPKVFVEYLEGNNIYACAKCNTHLSSLGELISKAFRSHNGTAYLFSTVTNIIKGNQQRRHFNSGMHTVCSIFCAVCQSTSPLGWHYIMADRVDQKYKEGKYILQQDRLQKRNWVDDDA